LSRPTTAITTAITTATDDSQWRDLVDSASMQAVETAA
jgi:hypothetical protein